MSRPMLFGKYCLLEKISTGGMAEVFRAKPLGSPVGDRFLALKRILPHLAEDDQFVKMFIDEAKLCVHLRHPNIVHIYELGHFQSALYILMEFIQGRDLLALQKRLRKRRLVMSVTQACYIAMELARGLDYAHKATDEHGTPLEIIHRDISPQNVLIGYDGQVKLIDFGVAKAADQSTKTRVGVLKGKFGYMSPEQIKSEPLDRRSDVFAVGIMLWEMLTNRRLFTGDNEYEVFQKVSEARVEPPSLKNPQIPPQLDRIVMKALAAKREDRYAWAAELVGELSAFLYATPPSYVGANLSDWMGRFFQQELAQERAKVRDFAGIRTAEDVRARVFGDQPGSAPGQGLWDAAAQPQGGEDLESFGVNHTVVQAGGFDLEEFISLDEADIVEQAPLRPERASLETESFGRLGLRPTATSQAQVTLDGGGTAPRPGFGGLDARGKAAIAAAGLGGLLCVVLGGALAVRHSSAPAAPGALVVSSSPAGQVKVSVDGQQRAAATPVSLEGLSAGTHRVRLERPGHAPFERTVEVGAGRLQVLDVVLKPQQQALSEQAP